MKHQTNTSPKENAIYYTTTDGKKIGIDKDGVDIYSDARVLTIYELMRLMSIPHDWPVPLTTNKQFLRHIIGEGVPSLFVKRIFENIQNVK